MRWQQVISLAGNERGVTLLEILIALALFALIAIGTLGALGATSAGGFLEGLPVAFATSRTARDITAASVYVQRLQEYMSMNIAAAVPGKYCTGACSGEPPLPVDYPLPSSESIAQPYQLNWTKVEVLIESWGWDSVNDRYAPSLGCTDDCLFLVKTTLTWKLQTWQQDPRTVEMERFVRP
jgi:prepilin-type N-terminal cleavage/methylation domain-containing protein